VADAIEAARGPRSSADLDALNLAELLTDAEKVYVPRRGEQVPSASVPGYTTSSPAPGATPAAVVSINSADQVALEAIPGIGPVKATAILDYRTQIGSFTSIDQLLDVNGIGPATLEAIRPYVTL
jgi:competence protein ComEA